MVQLLNDRSNQRSGRKAETRRLEILSAAARTFRRLGFHAAGMREIAAEADLSPGNLYHYFNGKDEILFFCQERFLERMSGVVGEAVAEERDPGARLRRIVEAHVRALLDELEGAVAHVELDSLEPRLRERLVDGRDRYERALREIVEDGVGMGEFRPCDPTLVTRGLLGALNWTVRWYDRRGPTPVEEIARGLADYLVGGLEPRDGGVA